MQTYYISRISANTFELAFANAACGRLTFQRRFSASAIIKLGPEEYMLKTVGLFRKSLKIILRKRQIGSIYWNRKGKLVIELNFQSIKTNYFFKKLSWWKPHYGLEGDNYRNLISLNLKYHYTKKRFEISGTLYHDEIPDDTDRLLILLSAYCLRYYIDYSSSAIKSIKKD